MYKLFKEEEGKIYELSVNIKQETRVENQGMNV